MDFTNYLAEIEKDDLDFGASLNLKARENPQKKQDSLKPFLDIKSVLVRLRKIHCLVSLKSFFRLLIEVVKYARDCAVCDIGKILFIFEYKKYSKFCYNL